MQRVIKRSLLVVFLLLAGISLSHAKIDPNAHRVDLEPQKVHKETLAEIVKALRYGHYRKQNIDDDFSRTLLQTYLDRLDRNRLYFLADDIAEFRGWETKLDDAVEQRDLEPAFAIFNRFQQRNEERLKYLLSLLDQGLDRLDFEADERLQLDRSMAPWPASGAELDDLWRKRLKSTVLNLKLSGKTLAEAEELLQKRYRNQLNRLYQTNADDAFQLFANAMTSLYGPHTQYFSPRRSENFNIDMRLSLEGIGAVLQSEDENTKVVRLIPGGPAARSGLLSPSDVIVGVGQGDEGEILDVVGWRLDEVVDLIRGPKGTKVRLEIIPAGAEINQTRVITLERNEVKLEEQAASKQLLESERNGIRHRIGVITIPTFYLDFTAMREGEKDYRSTTRDVRRLLDELLAEGAEAVLIDLRNNGGGSLREAIQLAGLFIPRGPVVQIKDAWGRIRVEYDKNPVYYDLPLAVLVNRLSASASEIFAAAIRDYDRGLIVGSRTYGKGTVQALHPLEYGQLKLTQATFYRIAGPSTQHQGVDPHLSLPAIYDPDEVGESAQERALPWDEVKPVPHRRFAPISALLPELEVAHQARMARSPDLIALRDSIEESRKRRREWLPLRESELRKMREEDDQWRLALENRRRAAHGLPPLKSVAELEKASAEQEQSKDPKDDPLLMEAREVLTDFMLALGRNQRMAASGGAAR